MVVVAFLLAVSVFLLVALAQVVPWTGAAAAFWLLSAPVFVASAFLFGHEPLALRVLVIVLGAAWCLIVVLPDRSPLGPLSRAEWSCQKVMKGVSAGARAAYLAGTLSDQRAVFVAELEALEPPNDLWRTAKTAQLLDLRADPPQVGVGDATNRLVTWPWRDALDHRVLRIRIRLDDAKLARRLRHLERPGFDDMTSSMRYDYHFLRNIWVRFDRLRSRDGGLRRWHDEVEALADLAALVRTPDDRWDRLRDLTVDTIGLELKRATGDLSAIEKKRLANAGDELRQAWADLSARDARGLPFAAADPESTTRP